MHRRIADMLLLQSILFISLAVLQGRAHPQCLDFLPPFFKDGSLGYCDHYGTYTCCTTMAEQNVRRDVIAWSSLISSTAPSPDLCVGFVRNITCAQCSPYAAHVFDAESTGQPRLFAGLCQNYCNEFFQACGSSVATALAKVGNRSTTSVEFCRSVELTDKDYCYPDVLDYEQRQRQRNSNGAGLGDLGCLCVQEVMTGLRNPVLAVPANDNSHRLFVGEQLGVVRVLMPDGKVLSEPFLDLQDIVETSSFKGDERGFLGMTFHPNHSSNGLVFVHLNVYMSSTNKRGLFNHVLRFRVRKDNPNQIDRLTRKLIFEVEQPFGNHNGGEIFFADDGYLYIFLGDGGGAGDPWNNGLNKNTILGSVMRINIDTETAPYTIPPDNPFVNITAARPEIFAYGLRNPWRCSRDRGDRLTGAGRGRIFCGDVGQNAYEEIDLIEKGANYGWKAYEGDHCFDKTKCSSFSTSRRPIHEYPHSVGKSVTGGYVYRGCASPNLQGLYIFADFISGRMFSLNESSPGQWDSKQLCLGNSSFCNNGLTGKMVRSILSFGEDEAGEIYVLSTDLPSNTHTGGRLYRLVDPARRGDPVHCATYYGSPDLNSSSVPVHFSPAPTPEVDIDTPSSSSERATVTELTKTVSPSTSSAQTTASTGAAVTELTKTKSPSTSSAQTTTSTSPPSTADLTDVMTVNTEGQLSGVGQFEPLLTHFALIGVLLIIVDLF